MNRATKRIRCAACRAWIEIGETIAFTDVKYHRRDLRMPMHVRHDEQYRLFVEIIQALIERSESERIQTFTYDEVSGLPRWDESDSWVI